MADETPPNAGGRGDYQPPVRHHDDPWDFKHPKSILSDYDLSCIAYGISDALHYCTGIPSCRPTLGTPGLCVMCGNAMRLVVQSAEPRIIEQAVKRMARAVGHQNIDLHPRISDD